MNAHPVTLEMLADWLDGRLTPEAHQAVAHHLEGCAHCAAEVAWLGRFVRAARAEPLPGPPAELVLRAQALYDRRQTRASTSVLRWFPRVRLWSALTAVMVLVILAISVMMVLGKEGSAVIAPTDQAPVSLVEVKQEDDLSWRPVPPAESLPAGSYLRVAQGGAQITLFDGSSVRVDAGTELRLARLQRRPLVPAGRQVMIEQNAGSAEYIVQPAAVPWAEFEVRVPVGSIIVRGTRFRVEVQNQVRARVRVLEGVVEVVGDVDRAEVYVGGEAVLERGAPVVVVPAQGASTKGEQGSQDVQPTAPPATMPPRSGETPEMTPRPERTPGLYPTPMPSITPGVMPTHTRRRPTEPLPTPTGGEPPIPTVTRRPQPTGTPMPAPTVMPRPTMPPQGPHTPTPTVSPWPTRAPGPTPEPTITPWATPTRRHGPGPQPSPSWTPIMPWETPTAGPPAWPTPDQTPGPWPTPAQTPGPWPTPEPTQGYCPSPGPGTPRR